VYCSDTMTDPMLDVDERLDTIPGTPLRLIQKIDGTAFAIDTLLLADFIRLPASAITVADLGSGSGILCFLLSYRRASLQCTGFEIQEEYHRLALRNQELHPESRQIAFEQMDIRDIPSRLLPESFDLVVANPPYYPKGSGRIPEHPGRALARHELAGTLADFVAAAAYLLSYGSTLNLVIPAGRIHELFALLKEHQFGMRRLQFVIPKEGEPAHLALCEAERFFNGRHEPLPHLIIHMADGSFSDDLNRLFTRGLRRHEP
jgi:tRNA1Val (adenine37-N6)-methyltransferase